LNPQSFVERLTHASALMTLAFDDVSNLLLVNRETPLIAVRMRRRRRDRADT
jgi:hypothetical protein